MVVVGNGMVGARLHEETLRRDPERSRVRMTVLGAEPVGGCNRVLLPALLTGSLTEADLLPEPAGPEPLATGTTVTAVDRAARTLGTADGRRLRYDRLVLATGARPVLPALPGLAAAPDDGGPHPAAPARGVTALRTLADARRLARLADRARARGSRIAVLGGGVLGLEAARALVARGVAVTVVHSAAHLMDRQLDAPAARVLSRVLRRTGVEQRLGTAAPPPPPTGSRSCSAGPSRPARRTAPTCPTTRPCAAATASPGARCAPPGPTAPAPPAN